MGGYGSGQHFRSRYYRYTVEDCLSLQIGRLDLRKLLNEPEKHKYFSTLQFYKNNELFFETKCFIENRELISVGTKYGDCKIKLIYQSTGEKKYSGKRLMFCCPHCGQKKLTLFLKPPYYDSWLCRTCHNLTYDSSKESSKPGKLEFMLAANTGITLQMVCKSLNHFRRYRYLGNYTIENLYNEDTFMKQTGIKLSAFELKELEKLAKELDLSRSEIIRRSLDHYIYFLKLQKSKMEDVKKID